MVSVAGLSELFEPPEIKAHTPAPRTLPRQADGASLRRSKHDGLASGTSSRARHRSREAWLSSPPGELAAGEVRADQPAMLRGGDTLVSVARAGLAGGVLAQTADVTES